MHVKIQLYVLLYFIQQYARAWFFINNVQ